MRTPPRPRRRAALALLAALIVPAALVTVPAVSAEDAGPVDETLSVVPAEPLLDAPERGRTAIRELGEQVGAAAARNDLEPDELRTLLRTDDSVWIDQQGLVLYVDPAPEQTTGPATAARAVPVAPLSETFALHSNPGADLTILLDVDGARVADTMWNDQHGLAPGDHPAWDPAGDGPAFSDAERLMVQQVWAMVAEDYAPFEVDVTTEDPGDAGMVRSSTSDPGYGARVLVTPSVAAHQAICDSACGGIAYFDVFARVASRTQPAWVFPQALGDSPKGVAEAASHEAGHNLALDHDGATTAAYYEGHGVWAPIMGVGYYRPLVQWSRGAYPGADNEEDDLEILTTSLGLRPDEAADSRSSPSELPDGEAVIGSPGDVDVYLLGACTAGAPVDVLPSAVAPNLDVRAVLHDGAGPQRSVAAPASGPGDGTTASGLSGSLTVPVDGEGWVLTVEGVGEGTWAGDGYDDYGSLGTYTVSAPGCAGGAAAGVPSGPRGVTGTAAGTDALTLRWDVPAVAGDGPVTGYVVSRSGVATTRTLGATARSHTFGGLTAGTTYQLAVRAVNATGQGPPVMVSVTTAPRTPAEPGPPGDVTGSYDRRTGSMQVRWSEPADTGTQPISGYEIHVDGVLVDEVGASIRAAGIVAADGFSPKQYEIGVAAVSGVGSSPVATTTVTVATSGPRAAAPRRMKPPGIVVRGRKAILTWPAANASGSPVTRYLVDIDKGRDRTVRGSARRVVLTRLKRGRNRVRVAARNAVGTSPYSRWARMRVR